VLVELKEELEFTKNYLYLLTIRYPEYLTFNIDISNQTLQTKVPPLTLQILVENAIKHNVINKDNPLFIEIKNTSNEIVVRNNFQPKKTLDLSLGTGLENIKNRYQFFTGQSIQIEQTELDFTVKCPLLAREVEPVI
jgi:LytS/YehU family sensor histidine kinase